MNENDVLFEIKKLHQSIIKNMMKGCNIKLHPSPTQIRIIDYLTCHNKEDIYQKDIESFLGISRATLSDVLNTMEKNNIIVRVVCPEDTRTKKVVLKKEALERHKEATKRMQEVNKIIRKDISKEDMTTFIKIIKKMKNNLDKEEE